MCPLCLAPSSKNVFKCILVLTRQGLSPENPPFFTTKTYGLPTSRSVLLCFTAHNR